VAPQITASHGRALAVVHVTSQSPFCGRAIHNYWCSKDEINLAQLTTSETGNPQYTFGHNRMDEIQPFGVLVITF